MKTFHFFNFLICLLRSKLTMLDENRGFLSVSWLKIGKYSFEKIDESFIFQFFHSSLAIPSIQVNDAKRKWRISVRELVKNVSTRSGEGWKYLFFNFSRVTDLPFPWRNNSPIP